MVRSGRNSAQVDNRARLLLKVEEGWSASQVAAAMEGKKGTVLR